MILLKKKLRIILLVVLIAVFITSTALLVCRLLDNERSADLYDRALDIALGVEDAEAEELPWTTWIPKPLEDDSAAKELQSIQLKNLRKYSDNVIGWIRIPRTDIDYPLVQGIDNEYYLKRAWDGTRTFSGAIFMEHMNSANFTDFNTIIYGHNMRNGSMFGLLNLYADEAFLKKSPYVYILTDTGVYRYEIFAAYEAKTDSPTYYLSFNQDQAKAKLLNHALESSVVDAGVEPALTDRILTLSTCTNTGYSSRWVVQARLEMIEVPLEKAP